MSKVILMKSGDSSFLVEVDEQIQVPKVSELGRGVPTGMEPVVNKESLEREFDEVKSLITTVCNGLFEAVSNIPKPKEVVAEFGIKLGGEAAVPFITKVSAEGNFKVSIKWSSEE